MPDSDKDDLLIMVWITVNNSPPIGCDVISLGHVCVRIITTNSQRRSFKICQTGPIMLFFGISMIVVNTTIVTKISGCEFFACRQLVGGEPSSELYVGKHHRLCRFYLVHSEFLAIESIILE